MSKNLVIGMLVLLCTGSLTYAFYQQILAEKVRIEANYNFELMQECEQRAKMAEGEAIKQRDIAKQALQEAFIQRELAEEALSKCK